VEAKLHVDGQGLLVRTRNADQFFRMLNRIIVEHGLSVEGVAPADDDVHSVYEYLIGTEGGKL
jgi:ABC-2 type transport system ATP-binding protein